MARIKETINKTKDNTNSVVDGVVKEIVSTEKNKAKCQKLSDLSVSELLAMESVYLALNDRLQMEKQLSFSGHVSVEDDNRIKTIFDNGKKIQQIRNAMLEVCNKYFENL